MAFDPTALLAYEFPDIRQSYVPRDAILYALGVGLGRDPLARQDLKYLLETELSVLPTMAVTLGTPGMWVRAPKLGINVPKLVHSAQSAHFHAPLPPQADIVASARIASLADRGEGKGAVVVVERHIRDSQTGTLYCSLQQTLLLRADGGFGGPPPERTHPLPPPARVPDRAIAFETSPRAALIYRLSGDWNPLHSHPDIAVKAGFERPILHGFCSYGIAGWVLMQAFGTATPKSLSLRFAGVVVPGDVLDFSIWRDGSQAVFEAKVADRTVLDQGVATFEE
jgi:acyl dehydratase